MIEIKITQTQITELKDTKEVIVKNPEGKAKIYLSVVTRLPLTTEDFAPRAINIRLGINYGDISMLEDTGMYQGKDFKLIREEKK